MIQHSERLQTLEQETPAMTNALIAPPYQLSSTRHGTMLANANDVYMGQAFLRYGECCEIEIRLLLSLLKVPGMVIEVGANMGGSHCSDGYRIGAARSLNASSRTPTHHLSATLRKSRY